MDKVKYGRNVFNRNIREIIKNRNKKEAYWELKGQLSILKEVLKELEAVNG